LEKERLESVRAERDGKQEKAGGNIQENNEIFGKPFQNEAVWPDFGYFSHYFGHPLRLSFFGIVCQAIETSDEV